MDREKFPWHLKRTRKWYRLGYAVANACGVGLVVSIPGSVLWRNEAGEATVEWGELAAFGLAVAFSLLAFFAVQGSDPGYLHSGAFEESADQGAEEGFLALLPEQEVSHHNARKEEDDGGDEKTRSVFAEEGKGADLSPGVVGTGARHRGAAGQRRDRRGEGGETGAERLLGDVSFTSEYHGPNSGYLSTGDSPERRSAEGDRGNARGDVEGCAARESSTVDYVRCARCEGMKVPLRSHHCRECGLCVATFDHHCQVIGTCIGEGNHCRFWWFLLAQSTALAAALRITISGFSSVDSSSGSEGAAFGTWFLHNALPFASSVFLSPCFVLAAVLLVTHTWMAISSMTSYECALGPEPISYLKETREFDLPFSAGLGRNLRGFCCARDFLCWWSWREGRRLGLGGRQWDPWRWPHPGRTVRDSEDWRSNLWENKYWSCC